MVKILPHCLYVPDLDDELCGYVSLESGLAGGSVDKLIAFRLIAKEPLRSEAFKTVTLPYYDIPRKCFWGLSVAAVKRFVADRH